RRAPRARYTEGVPDTSTGLTWSLVQEARERIAGKVSGTPTLTSSTLDAEAGAHLYFKCESFQKSGSFKARGATNAVFALSPEQARSGVATHSSGNHAAALARAARLRGVPAYIVMPDNSPQAKRAAVARYGGEITYCQATLGERPFAVIRNLVDDITTVTDPLIVRAMRRLFEVMKIVVEPSGAVPYAALLDERPALRGRRIGLIVSGGNLDLERLPWTVAP